MADMTLREYLELVTKLQAPYKGTKVYSSTEEFVLVNGKEFNQSPLTHDETTYLKRCIRFYAKTFPIKLCFHNSQLLMMLADPDHRLTYVEGFCLPHIPTYHGWLELGGKVVDMTMRLREPMKMRKFLKDRAIGDWNDGRTYFGVRFNRSYVIRRILKYESSAPLIDDDQARWPLLREKLDDVILT